MPPLAIALGAAAITAGGQYLASKSQKKAASKAAAIQADASREANALTREIYDRNVGYASPWLSSGQTANNAFMELLGLPSGPQPSAFAAMPTGGASPYPYAFGETGGSIDLAPRMVDGEMVWEAPQGNMQYGSPAPVNTGLVTTSAPSARSAFDTYKGSTGYDFRFNEGMRALQSAFSRNLESGAASKAALRYGQGLASDEFGRYMDLLRGQSQLGFGAASALAGVGQNFGNTINASNRLAADAASNARLYAGQSNAAMWQGLGSSFGQALGALGGSGARKYNPYVLGM